MAVVQSKKQEFENKYWRYYLMLEKEFIDTLEYVELRERNYNTSSLKYCKMLLSIGSEVDNMFKVCTGLTGYIKIEDYINPIISKYPLILIQKVYTLEFNIELILFMGWNKARPSKSLLFWNSYNEVKHNRIDNFDKASLGVVINALAALFILEMYVLNQMYLDDKELANNYPTNESKLFILDNWSQHVRTSKVSIPYSVYDDEDGLKLI